MAHLSLIPPPAKMDVKSDVVDGWRYFKDSWSYYSTAMGLDKKEKTVQVATLLTVMGKECHTIYKNLPITAEDRKDPAKILDRLGEHFEPKRNVTYERHMFNSRIQASGESFNEYVNALRDLAKSCEYDALLDEMLNDRIVSGIWCTQT